MKRKFLISLNRKNIFVKKENQSIYFNYCIIFNSFIPYFLFCLEVIIKRFRTCRNTEMKAQKKFQGSSSNPLHTTQPGLHMQKENKQHSQVFF